MAVKAVRVSDVPNLDQRPENATFSQSSSSNTSTALEQIRIKEEGTYKHKLPNFVVMGHRGLGMNMLQSPDPRLKCLKENSILSFNAAAKFPIHFIEFDVQVTRDDCPVIFHDNFILTQEKGVIIETRVTDLTLAEFLCFGPQKEHGKVGKPLFRKTKDGKILAWIVENDDPLCTLQEVFDKIEHSVGFNIELKFDDEMFYKHQQLTHILQVILQVVNEHAKNRPIIFSSFHPDAAILMRKLQDRYPVFFITNGGSELHVDLRRNSVEEAIELCLGFGLQGIVCEVKAILRNLDAIPKTKDSNLQLFTYGQFNNVAEVVLLQHWMGVRGVIVDLVREITEALTAYSGETKTNGLVLTERD